MTCTPPATLRKRTIALGMALLCSTSFIHAGITYSAQDRVLTIPSVNVPGVGAFQAQLTSPEPVLRVGMTLQITLLQTAPNPVDIPASYTFGDQMVLLPAVAVRGVDGSLNYFDVKLRNINSSNSSFVVESVDDTKLGYSTGAAGPQGETGPQGLRGLPGATGATGAAGPQGTQGLAGMAGATGAIGATGAVGPTGAQGIAGATGATGTMAMQGTWSGATTYAQNQVVYYNGSAYSSLTNSNAGNTPDASPTQWALLASMGATGSAGPVGATGSVGPVGATGSVGPVGATGSVGPVGATGSAGPVGATGSAGPVGATGAASMIPGPTGPTGPAGAGSFTRVAGTIANGEYCTAIACCAAGQTVIGGGHLAVTNVSTDDKTTNSMYVSASYPIGTGSSCGASEGWTMKSVNAYIGISASCQAYAVCTP
jgi:hypothetical protein